MAKSRRDSRRWRPLLLSLALAPVGCGPEFEVLSTPPDKEAPGAAGTGMGTGGSTGGTAEGGYTSTGGVSTAGITSTGGSGIAGQIGGTGMGAYGGVAGEGATGGAPSCMRHLDCPAQYTCNGGACTPCADSVLDCTLACPGQQVRIAKSRNGCAICECAPLSECVSDDNCGAGEVCYRGAQCDDGCDGLECCDGNHCGPPGCSGPVPSCNLSGCEGGGVCQPSCVEPTCTCDGMTWICSDTGMSATGGSGGAGEGGVGAIGGNDCQGQCLPP